MDSGEVSTSTLRDSPDWTVLVNRLIIKKFGMSAATNRQDIRETEFPERRWEGTINGRAYTIMEVPAHPALAEVAKSAESVREAMGALTVAQAARDEAVRAALLAGISVKDLVPASGLTRSRVYQIRDYRR